jgi:poly(3-hydroxyalkanoate) synthetase
MTDVPSESVFQYPEVGVGYFWPFGLMLQAESWEMDQIKRNLDFLREVEVTQVERPRPEWSTANREVLRLRVLTLRDFTPDGAPDGPPVLVIPPYAGHTSVIADFQPGQSLVETLLENGVHRVLSVDWHSATPDMADLDVDDYLAAVNVCTDDLCGPVSLVGLCQGGWLAAMFAARYPQKVRSLVLAGSPLDTSAGGGAIESYANRLPMGFFEELVSIGGGRLPGRFMLRGFKNMHPEKQYFEKFAELYEHAEDPSYRRRFEQFERWYEYTLDLPGRWYLQVISQLFRENRFFQGNFTGLGRTIGLKDITCPTYLLAGEDDDITPREQVFAARERLGTPSGRVTQDLVPGGHIGLFMGRRTLHKSWPPIARWLVDEGASA